ncbi:methyltransferase domain-containing protein [Thalassotalea psychrophila]|uniref:Methyltransferase domain-containing protein n=1 Tax=Thalassotalea psychrophila TaxID=3065647 RepID=A0ABY9TX51_9GAMM|nr:methyltransferase domain-containing protein [Colwelliaceae bacterium SQ149]
MIPNIDTVEPHSSLLTEYLAEVKKLSTELSVLDLACGSGRNGLYLASNDISVTFADRNKMSLDKISDTSVNSVPSGKTELWQVDFEDENTSPLSDKCFSAVIVYRYLHRPLFESIKTSIQPGGLVIYETFTTEHPQFGRPKNPNFLLKHNELLQQFSGWEVLHYFEGIVSKGEGQGSQAIAQIVARKP